MYRSGFFFTYAFFGITCFFIQGMQLFTILCCVKFDIVFNFFRRSDHQGAGIFLPCGFLFNCFPVSPADHRVRRTVQEKRTLRKNAA